MKNKRIRLILFLGGILLLFFTWSFLIPKVNQVFQAKDALGKERLRLEKLKIKLADLQGLNEFELSSRTQFSLRAIPVEKNFIEVVGVLKKIAEQKGLVLESFQISPGTLSPTEKGKLAFKIGLVGNLDGIKSFLSETEKTLPLITPVGKITIDLQEEISTMDLSVESYFLPLPITLGPIESPVPKLSPAEEKVLATLSGFAWLPSEAAAPAGGGRPNPFTF